MSQVLWCDIGQHAFPANQPGKTTIKVGQAVKNQWGGVQETDFVQDVCSACASDAGIRQMADAPEETREQQDAQAREIRQQSGGFIRSRLKALTNGDKTPEEAKKSGYDEDYVAFLEWKDKQYRETQDAVRDE